jgi:hypothetical protein
MHLNSYSTGNYLISYMILFKNKEKLKARTARNYRKFPYEKLQKLSYHTVNKKSRNKPCFCNENTKSINMKKHTLEQEIIDIKYFIEKFISYDEMSNYV